MKDLSAIPTIELMNCQKVLGDNMDYNQGILNNLTKAKAKLKGYDADNSKTNMLLKKLDSDYALLFELQEELRSRCSKNLDYSLESKKFDTLKLEVDAKFKEAAALYLQDQNQIQNPDDKQKEGVITMEPKGDA